QDLQQYEYGTTFAENRIDAVWQSSYNTIANINNILGYIEEDRGVLGDIDHSLIKGELLGLRAFLHFDLLRLFRKGALDNRPGLSDELTVPYVTEYSKDIPKRYSYTQTFDLLLQDIKDGLALLELDPIYTTGERPEGYEEIITSDNFYSNRKLRMNYYALKALQARVLAWLGGDQNLDKARTAAVEVINGSDTQLIDGQSYNVSANPTLFPELLFSLRIEGLEDITNPLLNASSGDVANDEAVFYPNGTIDDIYETSNANIGPPDIRFNSLLEQQARGYVSLKLLQTDAVTGSASHDIVPLIKLPEMYYIAAEYYINTNQRGQAIDYLNTVRTSRGIVQQIPEDAKQQELEDELFKEYRKEFISEGQLFYYYKRLGLETLPNLSQDITVDDDIYVLPYPDSENIFR